MHGVIFLQLRKFVEENLGEEAWDNLVKEAGIPKKIYLPISEYPDEDAIKLIAAAVKLTGKPLPDILRSFGVFIAPALLKMYREMVKPEWKTLDLIENTEQTIHKVVRIRNPGAEPPRLQTKRVSPTEVLLIYTSKRKMCDLAKGISLGIANHYGEQIRFVEKSCMNKGDPICEIHIHLEKSRH